MNPDPNCWIMQNSYCFGDGGSVRREGCPDTARKIHSPGEMSVYWTRLLWSRTWSHFISFGECFSRCIVSIGCVVFRPVYSNSTQLDVELSWVELCRYKRAFSLVEWLPAVVKFCYWPRVTCPCPLFLTRFAATWQLIWRGPDGVDVQDSVLVTTAFKRHSPTLRTII